MEAIAGPFIGTEAVAAGLVTRRQLKSRYVAVYRNVYLAKGIELTACSRAKAAWLWSGRGATLAGLSAAAVYGSRWIDPGLPAALCVFCRRRVGVKMGSGRLSTPTKLWAC